VITAPTAFSVSIVVGTAAPVLALFVSVFVVRRRDRRRNPLGDSGMLDFGASQRDPQWRPVRQGRLRADERGLLWAIEGSDQPERMWSPGSVDRWATRGVFGGVGCLLVVESASAIDRFGVNATRRAVRHSLRSVPWLGPIPESPWT
jgi:hypothetical protein